MTDDNEPKSEAELLGELVGVDPKEVKPPPSIQDIQLRLASLSKMLVEGNGVLYQYDAALMADMVRLIVDLKKRICWLETALANPGSDYLTESGEGYGT